MRVPFSVYYQRSLQCIGAGIESSDAPRHRATGIQYINPTNLDSPNHRNDRKCSSPWGPVRIDIGEALKSGCSGCSGRGGW